MQRSLVIVAALASVLAYPTCGTAQTLSSLSLMLSMTDGSHASVADIGMGRVTVLTFWMTSCTPSKWQLDAMRPVVAEFSDSVRFVAISIDNVRTIARVAPLVASKGYNMTVLLDPTQELFTLLNGSEHPYTIIFAADGRSVWKQVGFYPGDEEHIRAEILKLNSNGRSND